MHKGDWRELLTKLVGARGSDLFPLSVFQLAPPSGTPWPERLPSCPGLRDFYERCDGGPLSCGQSWFPLSQVEVETERWRESLHDYFGDGQPVLVAGQHVVFAVDAAGAPFIWDAQSDRVSTFYFKGGTWEPYHLDFEQFMQGLFFSEDMSDDLWVEALAQVTEMT